MCWLYVKMTEKYERFLIFQRYYFEMLGYEIQLISKIPTISWIVVLKFLQVPF